MQISDFFFLATTCLYF